MSRNFDGVLANQPGASYRSENNDWAQDWLTNRSGAGVPATITAYGTYVDTDDSLFKVRNAANNASYSLFDVDGVLRPKGGTAAAPSHAFSSDATTGLYLVSTGVIGIAAGGTLIQKVSTSEISIYTPLAYSGSSSTPIYVYKTSTSGNVVIGYDQYNSTNSQVRYAAAGGTVNTTTAGAEVGSFIVQAMKTGTLTLHTSFHGSGYITTGSSTTQITNTTGTLRHAAIEQNGASSGQVLAWNGSAWAPASAGSGTVSGSGTTNTIAKFTAAGAVGNSTITDDGSTVAFYTYLTQTTATASTFGTTVSGYASRGTIGTPTEVLSGDNLFNIWAYGRHSTGWGYAGTVGFAADAAPSGTVVKGKFLVLTTNAAGTLTTALTINSSQAATFAGTVTTAGTMNADTFAATAAMTSPSFSGGSWLGSVVGLAYGGTNKNMTAVNGGIVWTDADSMEVSAAGSSGQMLRSAGAAAPVWSTPTWPNAATTTGAYLRADGTNFIQSTLILPNAATANRIVYATATDTYGESGNLTFNGSTLTLTGAFAPSGAITQNADTDVNNVFGRVRIDSRGSDAAYGSHYDMSGTTQYAWAQSAAGATSINSASGQSSALRIAGAAVVIISSTGASVTGTLSCSSTLTTSGVFRASSGVLIDNATQTVTIASDSAAVSNSFVYVALDPEGAGTTDGLNTITGGTDGQHIYIKAVGASDVITVANKAGGTGQIVTGTGGNLVISSLVEDTFYHFVYRSSVTTWYRVL